MLTSRHVTRDLTHLWPLAAVGDAPLELGEPRRHRAAATAEAAWERELKDPNNKTFWHEETKQHFLFVMKGIDVNTKDAQEARIGLRMRQEVENEEDLEQFKQHAEGVHRRAEGSRSELFTSAVCTTVSGPQIDKRDVEADAVTMDDMEQTG